MTSKCDKCYRGATHRVCGNSLCYPCANRVCASIGINVFACEIPAESMPYTKEFRKIK